LIVGLDGNEAASPELTGWLEAHYQKEYVSRVREAFTPIDLR